VRVLAVEPERAGDDRRRAARVADEACAHARRLARGRLADELACARSERAVRDIHTRVAADLDAVTFRDTHQHRLEHAPLELEGLVEVPGIDLRLDRLGIRTHPPEPEPEL